MTDRQIPEEKRETPSEPVPGTTGQTVRSASREPVFGDNARKRTGEGDSADGQNGGASGQTVREKRTPKSGSTERRADPSAAGTAGEPSGEGGEKEKKAEEAPEEAGRRKRRRRREKEERAADDGDLRTGEKRKIKEKSAGESDEQEKTSENGEAGKGGARGGFRDSWKISVAVTAFLMAVSILVTFQVTFLVLREKYQRTLDGMRLAESDLAKLSQVQSLFEREYVGEVNKTAVLDALLKSYVRAAGDKYSEYYTAEEYEALQSVQRGEAVGIGVIVTEDETGIRVQWVSEGSPAEKAGVQMGDLIVAVDGKGKETDSYETMVDAVRGEIGSEVVLDIRRPAEGGEEPVVLKVTRAEYTSSSVTYRLLQDGKTGYIRILTFDGTTAKQFLSAVELLQKQGADRMVFDLRGNGGGLLTSVVEILDALLPEGTIVTTRDAAGEEKVYSSDEKELRFPMAVLCNGSTASAAELFTAALRDYKKATLVGETTYGKGVAQNTFRLGDGSAVKLTTSYYDPPSGVNYDGVGVTPDVLVTVPEGYTVAGQYSLNESEDAQLQAAVAALTDGGEP